ncbi:electron transfer flavoprotein subunit beta/FixA family protein [Actinokineospora globicatena]|uniref:electron transfer flavoprotein subunit beta/FixA family protein n=1 Tax=Actinokineospora globicatena TaxID=103729 RepID=UPI0020A50488|nr:electron transfer flavoprotein subunit beta/FixA family protein [Actinokineospora globicatena]MCP2305461.1 electron transfer flavoprotein beta subunit [Actinokineospora globicatena]GLW81329.1 electron transfer flavoprotein subunit beta [Actinokineospora globicatena]GLW87973.1 electron transfer flavoprotein subunit beta [Actinokineospora globicatena]
MPNIVVLVKQVPDTYSERRLAEADHTLDRESADAVLDEINERAVEEALLIKEAHGGEVTVLSVGPERATEAIRKALSMGADKAVHVTDPALHGSCLLQTTRVLAAAIGKVDGVDLVIAGNEATDGRGGAIPAMLAEVLGYPQLTHARKVTVDGSAITVTRETDTGLTHLSATLPAVVSVGEKINEPRYPSFKGIMAAKKKPVETFTVADLGIDAAEVGLAAASTTVLESTPKPPRSAGQRVEDAGDGGAKIAEYLIGQKLI